MKIEIKKPILLPDINQLDNGSCIEIPEGIYELEEIILPVPMSETGATLDWYRIKGTDAGSIKIWWYHLFERAEDVLHLK